MRLFCFGFGYSAEALARRLSARVSALGGTRTSLAEADGPLGAKLAVFQGDGASAEVRGLLAGTTHLLVSVPPDLEGDMVLRHFRDDLAGLPELAWIGYLSTVGVYGDCRGEWVDETSADPPHVRAQPAPRAGREGLARLRRRERPARRGLPALRHLRSGAQRDRQPEGRYGATHRQARPGVQPHPRRRHRARTGRRDRPAARPQPSTTSSDDEPAPPQDVVAYAAELLGLPVPPDIPFERAGLSGMAASFWAESKRVSNARIKTALGVELAYPTYREGLRAHRID